MAGSCSGAVAALGAAMEVEGSVGRDKGAGVATRGFGDCVGVFSGEERELTLRGELPSSGVVGESGGACAGVCAMRRCTNSSSRKRTVAGET